MNVLKLLAILCAGLFIFAIYNNPYLFETEAQKKLRIEKEEQECLAKFISFRDRYIKEEIVPIARKSIEAQKLRLEQAVRNKEKIPEVCSTAISSSVSVLGFGASVVKSYKDLSVYCEIMIAHRTPLNLATELASTTMKTLIEMESLSTPEGKCNLPLKVIKKEKHALGGGG